GQKKVQLSSPVAGGNHFEAGPSPRSFSARSQECVLCRDVERKEKLDSLGLGVATNVCYSVLKPQTLVRLTEHLQPVQRLRLPIGAYSYGSPVTFSASV